MSHLQCECGEKEWLVSELVPGELTLFCSECGDSVPLSEEWQVYADYEERVQKS